MCFRFKNNGIRSEKDLWKDISMIIKVCGLHDLQNIHAVEQLNIDWTGLVFNQDSPRNVSMISSRAGIIPDHSSFMEEARTAENPLRVGVFANEMPQNIVTRIYNFKLDLVQLNGDESPTMINNLRKTVDPDIRQGIKMIKTIRLKTQEDLRKTKEFAHCVDFFRFDGYGSDIVGDNGRFDWRLLASYQECIPFILSGGIAFDDIERLRDLEHPQWAGIELNSCFEDGSGLKDISLLKTFLTKFMQPKTT